MARIGMIGETAVKLSRRSMISQRCRMTMGLVVVGRRLRLGYKKDHKRREKRLTG